MRNRSARSGIELAELVACFEGNLCRKHQRGCVRRPLLPGRTSPDRPDLQAVRYAMSVITVFLPAGRTRPTPWSARALPPSSRGQLVKNSPPRIRRPLCLADDTRARPRTTSSNRAPPTALPSRARPSSSFNVLQPRSRRTLRLLELRAQPSNPLADGLELATYTSTGIARRHATSGPPPHLPGEPTPPGPAGSSHLQPRKHELPGHEAPPQKLDIDIFDRIGVDVGSAAGSAAVHPFLGRLPRCWS